MILQLQGQAWTILVRTIGGWRWKTSKACPKTPKLCQPL
jgi:hypothetical protein